VTPPRFRAVGQWYRKFDQTSDEEVQDLLAQAWATMPGQEAKRRPQPNREEPT
jgi:predicted phosphoribosyltransferase